MAIRPEMAKIPMSEIHEISCDCGAIRLIAYGEPTVSAYCHCEDCRRLYGVEVLSASAWPANGVKRMVSDGAELIAHRLVGRRLWRYHCSCCGRLVHGRNRRDYIVIPNERFRAAAGGRLPNFLVPREHLFYNQRVLDVADDLPKHASGMTYPESHEV